MAPVQVSLRTHPKFVSLFAKKTHPICGLLLGGSRKGAVQLWLRKQRIYANALQGAGRPATEAKGSRGAAERQAGGESKPEIACRADRAAAGAPSQMRRKVPPGGSHPPGEMSLTRPPGRVTCPYPPPLSAPIDGPKTKHA